VGVGPDNDAVDWMCTTNFRLGAEMDDSRTPGGDETRYQTRGYAKYADLVRIFGCETLNDVSVVDGAEPAALVNQVS
jgi:hypothetical protein